MSYSLLTSERSPFGRICRMFMHANKIPFTLDVVDFLVDPAAAMRLSKANPINKVPILIDDGKSIYDSRVIINYLSRKHSVSALSIDEENCVSAIYGVMDASVSLFLLKRDGVEGAGKFFERNNGRIPSALKYITPWASSLDPAKDWKYPAMSLFACLDWAERRAETVKIAEHPKLNEFFRKFSGCPGARETSFE